MVIVLVCVVMVLLCAEPTFVNVEFNVDMIDFDWEMV